MKTFKLHVFLLFLMLTVTGFSQSVSHKFLKSKYLQTGVHFESNDTLLKKLFDVAEAKALENYSHYAEVGLIGSKLINKIKKTLLFTQQFDPYTSEQNGADNLGSTILSVLEYFSRMYDVYFQNDEVHFNGLAQAKEYSYSQRFGSDLYTIDQNQSAISGSLNGKSLFTCEAGVGIVCDLKGNILKVNGIDTLAHHVSLKLGNKIITGDVLPNCSYVLKDNKLILNKQVPFDYPYRKPE